MDSDDVIACLIDIVALPLSSSVGIVLLPSLNKEPVSLNVDCCKCLCEVVSWLVISINLEDGHKVTHKLSEEMELLVDVFHPWLNSGFICYCYCPHVVFEDSAMYLSLCYIEIDAVLFSISDYPQQVNALSGCCRQGDHLGLSGA